MGDGRGRAIEQEMLDVGNDPHGHARAIGPAQRWAIDDGRIRKAVVLLGWQRRLEHLSSPQLTRLSSRPSAEGARAGIHVPLPNDFLMSGYLDPGSARFARRPG